MKRVRRTIVLWLSRPKKRSFHDVVASCTVAACAALVMFYLSLIATSAPVSASDSLVVERAINVLEARGFQEEVLLLRHAAIFRGSDNWLNRLTPKDNAYAATNFPVQIITLYPDFYVKAIDDTERAMILLHEAQHLKDKDEHEAYSYVWEHRRQLGWTQLSHGTTPSYITIDQQTREQAPELFTCTARLWNDCTEDTKVRAATGKRN
jgi:hypothetical protein